MSNSTSLVVEGSNRYQYENILALQEDDLFRKGQAVNISNIFERFIYFIIDLFTGGTSAIENGQFDRVWLGSLSARVAELENLALEESYNAEFFSGIKKVLLVKAKIEVSGWARNLAGNANYQNLTERLNILHERSKPQVTFWADNERADEGERPAEVRRWIESSDFQRKFAAASPSGQLPYKMSEIPAGAILLSDVGASLTGLRVKGIKPTFCQYFRQFKAGLVKLATGSSVIHAEIALGGGRVYHIDKVDGQVLTGSGRIEDRNLDRRGNPRICFQHEVWVPNEARMVRQYNASNPSDRINGFNELFDKMRAVVDSEGEAVQANLYSIAKPGIPSRRPLDYNARAAWNPQSGKVYACSGAIASLFARYGIDMGRQFGKQVEDVSPADYRQSEYFRRHFVYENN